MCESASVNRAISDLPVQALAIGVFVLVAVLIVVGGIYGYLSAKRRRESFAAFATTHGWTYVERDDELLRAWDGDPFDRGHSRRASNIVSGVHDTRRFLAFDFRYFTTESSTDSEGRTTSHEVSHDIGVVALATDVDFPELQVRPEGMFGRFIGKLTNTDIAFESEDFNRAFTVTCEDRKFASDVLHPRTMEMLLRHPDLSWKFHGRWIVSLETGRCELPEITARLQFLDAILDGIPPFVWQEVQP